MTKGIAHQLRQAALRRDGGGLTDGQLLDRFIARREEAAFAALVHRHGPMVFGVCRRVLGNGHDAEDAFQATFLVLLRNAASVRPRELIGPWLYGVAYRTALKAKSMAAKRREKEQAVKRRLTMQTPADEDWKDLVPFLDRELTRLPEKYRVPVVLCELQGKSREEAARQLGLPAGTLSTRLARARVMLARRLGRYGVAVAVGTLPTLLADASASARVPAPLAVSIVKTLFNNNTALSFKVLALAQGVVQAMSRVKLRSVVLGALTLAVAGWALALLSRESPTASAQEARRVPSRAAQAAELTQQRATQGERLTLRGHEDEVLSLSFGPDVLATGGKDRSIRLWNVTTGKQERVFQYDKDFGAVERLLFSGDGTVLGLIQTGGGVALWGLPKGHRLSGAPGFGLSDRRFLALASDMKTWAGTVPDEEHSVELLEIDFMNYPEPIAFLARGTFKGHADRIEAVAFSTDDATLATASKDKTLKLWDRAKERERATCQGHRGAVVCVAFAPDGKQIASGSTDGTVRLWDAADGKEQAIYRGHEGTVHSVAFAPDGKRLAAGGIDQTVTVWDVATGQKLAVLKGHQGAIASVAFSRDGTSLASASADKTVKVWDLAK